MTSYKTIAFICLTTICSQLAAQISPNLIFVDDNGTMRWNSDSTELHGFGVNYTLPFAHEYRMAQRTGISPEEAVQQDVYHMARLDLDLYRVHVWDTEISDTLGNLIASEHLRLFDYTINEMKQRGMNFVITPIAFWGNGWPENDEPTPGFSYKYGKAGCLIHPDAIAAQANYLSQFLNHVNPYTGIAYKDEPNVLAFEISNEPHHDGSAQAVTAYINTMVAAMRQTGTSTPIFYNMSHSIHLVDAYLNANIQGGTFQWYPTNLVANHQINGNFLPHVKHYPIPFADDVKFKKMAKIVYEFDPADVGGNVMYPAMARTFRETGMQLATQFAYDAMCWAPFNTNYGTHFMNMAYAPNKAISMKIASAVFHNFPMGKDKTQPNALNINYENDLAEWITNEKFFYSNTTVSQPPHLSQLNEVAGCGSSPLVNYNGSGAYFLDKLSDGVWRLEVMPDAYWIDDPYSKASPDKQKTAVVHTLRQMKLSLPDLGNNFLASPLNNGNTYHPTVINGKIDLMPGVYILKRGGIHHEIDPLQTYKNIKIGEFVAPASNLKNAVLWNHSPIETTAGKPLTLDFETVSPSPINKVTAVLSLGDKWETLTATPTGTNSYRIVVPESMTETGFLNYHIMVECANDTTTFPAGKKENPWRWDNTNNPAYTIRIAPQQSPIVIWHAATDWENTLKTWIRSVSLQPSSDGETTLAIRMEQLPVVDENNQPDHSYAFKFFFGDKIVNRRDEVGTKKFLAVKTVNLINTLQPIEIGLIDKNGSVLSGKLNVNANDNVYKISLSSFKGTSFIIVPRPFPDFLPYRVQTNDQPFDWSSIEVLQVELKPSKQTNVNLNIEKIWLE